MLIKNIIFLYHDIIENSLLHKSIGGDFLSKKEKKKKKKRW